MIIDVMDLNFKSLSFTKGYERNRMQKARKICEDEEVEIIEVDKDSDGVIRVIANVDGSYTF